MHSVNRCVFSRRLKLSQPRSGPLKLSGKEFQSDGPAIEKARGPSVLSRHRGTTKRCRVVDRRCCRAKTLDTGTQRSARYRGDWLCKQLYIATLKFVLNSFWHIKPMKLWVQEPRKTSAVLVSTGDHTSSSIQYRLQPVKSPLSAHLPTTYIAIVNKRRYECVYQCCGRVHVQWAPDASDVP